MNSTWLSGPSSNRVDIVFIGDGYRADEMDTYNMHIDGMLGHMFSQEPFNRYTNYFNVHRIEVVSPESGADVPPDDIFVDTALNAKYFFDGATERLLYITESRANTVVDDALRGTGIDVDMRYATVNETKYGGGGGRYAAFAGGNESAYELALHEQGHSFSNLADEYVVRSGAYTGSEPSAVNATKSPNGEKWEQWMGYDQPGIGAIGVYEGALFFPQDIYRPSEDSKMRSLGKPFDAVAREKIVLDIYSHADPFDDFLDITSTVTHDDEKLWTKVIDPNVIEVEWSIDGHILALTSTEFHLASITDMGLLPGSFAVSVLAKDTTDWVRIRQEDLEQQLTWNVDYFPGDFDGNRLLNAWDIDALTSAVIAHDSELKFDMNRDLLVDQNDRDRWLEVNQTFYGDADLNGVVEFPDFLVLAENFGNAGVGWGMGDFDLDGVVAFADFLVLAENFGNMRAEPSFMLVPEPNVGSLLLLAALCFLSCRRARTTSIA